MKYISLGTINANAKITLKASSSGIEITKVVASGSAQGNYTYIKSKSKIEKKKGTLSSRTFKAKVATKYKDETTGKKKWYNVRHSFSLESIDTENKKVKFTKYVPTTWFSDTF